MKLFSWLRQTQCYRIRKKLMKYRKEAMQVTAWVAMVPFKCMNIPEYSVKHRCIVEPGSFRLCDLFSPLAAMWMFDALLFAVLSVKFLASI